MKNNNFRSCFFVILGSASLVVGIIMFFIPLIPTTPFTLFALFCYFNSSKKLYDWLLNHRLFGKYLNDYVKHKGMEKKTKILSLATLWVSLFVSIHLFSNIYVTLLLLIGGLSSTIYVLSLRTITEDNRHDS